MTRSPGLYIPALGLTVALAVAVDSIGSGSGSDLTWYRLPQTILCSCACRWATGYLRACPFSALPHGVSGTGSRGQGQGAGFDVVAPLVTHGEPDYLPQSTTLR